MAPTHVSRAEQRRQTEERILTAAREMFSECGYDRTTIRSVAEAASTDPGLVMRYFGSKEMLFSKAACLETESVAVAGPPELTEFLVNTLRARLTAEPTASLAMLRSMLTHPDATRSVREALNEQLKPFRDAIPSDDADLRSGLVSTIVLGVIIGKFLLEIDELASAPTEQVVDLLRPCLESLVHPESPS